MKQPEYPFKIGFLLSGSGSTLENLLENILNHQVTANVSVVISSREGVYGLERAKKWDIPHFVVPYKEYKNNINQYNDKITEILDQNQVDLVVLGGFMSPYIPPEKYNNKVINIHPSLIPAFSGKGYYGDHVHQAVLDYGVRWTGCTVHFVDQNYDTGPIIDQGIVQVDNVDNLESLKEKVLNCERNIYPKVIQLIVENRLDIDGRHIKILPKK